MCIDNVEMRFGIANEQISSVFELSACYMSDFSFPDNNFSQCHWNFTILGMCIDIVQIWFGVANG